MLPIAAVLSAGLGHDPREIPSPLIGKPAPSFTLTTIGGQRISSASLRGRPYTLNFWASWCIPACVEEYPVLIEAQRRHGNRVAIIGLLYQDTPENALRFLARYGDGGWPHLIDPDGRLAIDYGVTGPPETYFVDAAGIVRIKQFGPLTQQVMTAEFAALLATERSQ